MSDFQFLQNSKTLSWVVLAPRRAKRPNEAKRLPLFCPFCTGREGEENELYRIGGIKGDTNWQVRVLPNKYPFGPHHEIIIHSPDHHKSFGELPVEQAETIFTAYRDRYRANERYGQVYIFHNHGHEGGESLPHPHTQLVVVPSQVTMQLQPITTIEEHNQTTEYFTIFCPFTSQWPDEVWIVPKKRFRVFGKITEPEIRDMAFIINRLVDIYTLRHGHEFPFNFYIHPGIDWYLRLIPREKSLGGFEVGTGIYVNTQDPRETIAFIKQHFEHPDREKIKHFHRAEYKKHV